MRALPIVLAVAAFGFQPASPDLIVVNGRVFTADTAVPWVEALAIRGSQITEVGTTATIRSRAGAATRILDCGGRLVVPGLNDAHSHVGARPPGVSLTLRGTDPALDEVLAAIRAVVATAKPTDWIYGTIGERVLSDPKATRYTLDEVAPGRVVKLASWTGHGNIVSTAGLRALGIADREPDPPFGRYGRTPNGVVTGLLEEYADVRAGRAMARLAGRDAEMAALRRLSDEAISYGVTTIQTMSNAITARELPPLLSAASTAVRWRIIRFPVALTESGDPDSYARLPRSPAPLVTVSGVKWILDGTPVEHLSAMVEPYLDRKETTGRMNLAQEEIELVLRRSLSVGQQPMFHVTGDRGIDALLNAMEKVAPASEWQRTRLRIEHGEFVSGRRLDRVKRLGIVVVQNAAHFTIPDIMRARFGVDRTARSQTVKAIIDAGIPFALGGDGVLNPFLNMMFAVTHAVNPGQALTREQVLAAYTRGAAYAEFAEQEKGRLAKGMLADVAVLNQDVFTVPLEKLPETRAAVTIVNGRVTRYALRF